MYNTTRRSLLALREKQRLPLSALGRPALREIEPLINAGVLTILRSGAGEAIHVRNPDALAECIQTNFPAESLPANLPTRAQAVRRMRNTKQAGKRETSILLLRAFQPIDCSINGTPLDLCSMTSQCGAVALVLSQESQLTLHGKIGLIENQECFLNAEHMQLHVDAIIYTAGRLSGITLQHLATESLSACTFLHCPDYDPVGLNEYLRYKAVLGNRVQLHQPANLRELLQQYGKPALLHGKNGQLMQQLRQNAPTELHPLLTWMDEANAGLEQEILINSKAPNQQN